VREYLITEKDEVRAHARAGRGVTTAVAAAATTATTTATTTRGEGKSAPIDFFERARGWTTDEVRVKLRVMDVEKSCTFKLDNAVTKSGPSSGRCVCVRADAALARDRKSQCAEKRHG
jgi:hypothetical protein